MTTITTTGFGDVAPLSPLARFCTIWEMLTGLLYQVFIFSIVASAIDPAEHDRL